jgi:Holliday junction resolvase RusA-like endonuclease
MSYRLHFTIPRLPPMSLNGSHGHWAVAAAKRRKWKEAAIIAIGNQRPARPLEVAKVTFIRHSSSEPDDDNLRASFKPIRDALKAAGVVVDDKPANMPEPVYLHRKAKPKSGFIEVIVEAVA